jgi:hypothetical protein
VAGGNAASSMSLYGDAIAAMKRVILLDERVRTTSDRMKELSQEVRDMRERIIRIEAILELAMRDRPAQEQRSGQTLTQG